MASYGPWLPRICPDFALSLHSQQADGERPSLAATNRQCLSLQSRQNIPQLLMARIVLLQLRLRLKLLYAFILGDIVMPHTEHNLRGFNERRDRGFETAA